MSDPVFDTFSPLAIRRELGQIEAVLGHTIFDRRWHQDEYAELRVLEGATGQTLFNPQLVLDTAHREKVLGGTSLTYSPMGSPPAVSPWHYSFTPNPAGVRAP